MVSVVGKVKILNEVVGGILVVSVANIKIQVSNNERKDDFK